MNIERWVKTNRLTDEQLAIANELNERGIETFTDAVFSIGEPALAIISSSIAEPIAGLAGLGMAAFEDVNSGVKTIEQVKNALSYQPRTRGGKTGIEFVADTLQPVSDAFTAAEDYLGDNTLELTGSPLLAAGAATIPAAIAELNPLGKASKQATKMGIFAGKKAKTLDVPEDELILKDVSGLAMSDGGFSFEPPAFSEKMAARRAARKDIFRLPTKGDATNINHVTDLFDYSPSQLVNQIKVLDQNGIRNGGYLKQGDAVHTFYKDDGTSQLIDAKTNKVLIENDIDQTERLLKDEIINKAQNKKTPEQVEAEYEAKRAERLKAREAEALQKDSYKMQHTAPTRTDNSLGFDLTTSFGEDIYSPKALQYFGTGADYDSKALTVINRIRNNPDRMVTVYRAVPKEVNEINPKDWVTTTKEYALDHMKGEEGWHILKKDVRAGDIATDGNSIHEWGYDPE